MAELDVGGKIAKLRKERGFTQKDLADFLGVTDKAVSRWESGAGNPDIALLPKIAKLLGTTTDYLLSAQGNLPISTPKSDETLAVSDEKPLRVLSTLSKVFIILGSVLRCALLFLYAYRFRFESAGMGFYFSAIALAAIDAVICCVAFTKIDRATTKRELTAVGVFGLLFCSLPAGVFIFCIPRREFYDPAEKKEIDSEKPRLGRIVAGLTVMAVGVGFVVASIACFGCEFFGKKWNAPAVTGYQVMFDYANCYSWTTGSSGWLVFSFVGELALVLCTFAASCYWIVKNLNPGKANKVSFKGVIIGGTVIMVFGWTLGVLIGNSDGYTFYRAYEIPASYGLVLSTVFCIVGFNLCGIGFMVPLRRIVKAKREEDAGE